MRTAEVIAGSVDFGRVFRGGDFDLHVADRIDSRRRRCSRHGVLVAWAGIDRLIRPALYYLGQDRNRDFGCGACAQIEARWRAHDVNAGDATLLERLFDGRAALTGRDQADI